MLGPRARRDDQLVALDAALVRLGRAHGAVAGELEARDLDAGDQLRAGRLGLGLHAGDRVEVVREAALVLVQDGGHALGAPVREELLHVRVAGGLAGHERRVVADLLLALVDGREVGLLRLRADRHVADGVVGVGRRIGLPDLDAGLHELLHGRLEVVVAHDAAGDAGRAGAGMRLLEDHDVGAGALAAGGQLLTRWYAVERPCRPAPTTRYFVRAGSTMSSLLPYRQCSFRDGAV